MEQMREKEQWAEGADAAAAALKDVHSVKHPSRTLVERLILDEAAWPSLYDEWQQLVDKKPSGRTWRRCWPRTRGQGQSGTALAVRADAWRRGCGGSTSVCWYEI